MGHKKVCIDCRLTYNLDSNFENRLPNYTCPQCNNQMTILPHRFRPPARSNDRKWKVLEFLLASGFNFEKAGNVPETLIEAKEFIEFLARKQEILRKFKDKYDD